MAGICLIRLGDVRPRGLPSIVGVSSENAAHRIAIEWDDDGRTYDGVYVPRRDTSSRLNALVGGRLFPGEHHHARFAVVEDGERFHVALDGDDGETHVAIDARVAADLPTSSIFPSLVDASRFFDTGATGYSATSRSDGRMDGLVLRCARWAVEPLEVERVESSFFADRRLFPAGSVDFDCALLMRDIAHEWRCRRFQRSTG